METKLIVGLGNPGKEYEYTRHNLGYLTVKKIVENSGVKFELSSFKNSFCAECNIEQYRVYFLLPITYMNNSGIAVKQIIEKREISLDNILIICDDFNLDFRQLRIKKKGSDGGHNGLKSIVHHLGNKEFPRLRMGIGQAIKTGSKNIVVDYVLNQFTKKEIGCLDDFIEEASDCCFVWMREGISNAMQLYNKRKKEL